ncbi:MAG: hypothetical protein JXM70_21090 [Pirellulales bacterium]|nr:hypothetical protein [Pirellulales bacterium]
MSLLTKLRDKSLSARIAVLTAVEVTALAISLPLAWFIGGRSGMLASTIAAVSCLVGGALALGISSMFRAPSQAFVGVLLGMLFGMGVPLVVAIACHLGGGELSRSGVMFYLLIFFPITLTVKTAFSLPKTGSRMTIENGQAS